MTEQLKSTRVAAPTALMIIDVLKGFITQWTEHLPKQMDDLQSKFEHVVVSCFENIEGSPFRRAFANWQQFYPNSPDCELAFTPVKRAQIMKRTIYSALTPELADYLKTHAIQKVYVAGISTEVAILKTDADLFEAGFDVRVLSSYVASYNGVGQYQTGLELCRRFIGQANVEDTTWV